MNEYYLQPDTQNQQHIYFSEFQWNSVVSTSNISNIYYGQHSLDVPMMPLAQGLANAPFAGANIQGEAEWARGKLGGAFGNLLPSKTEAIAQGWIMQAAFQLRTWELISKGQYVPSNLILPPPIQFSPGPFVTTVPTPHSDSQ